MKHTISLVASLGLALAISCSSAWAQAGKALELFNGKDLSGWSHVSAEANTKLEQVWSVKDGLIVCTGAPMGYLHTEKKFKNFQLEVEYRWAPGQKPGNSGIFSRINGDPKALPRCIETQLKHTSAGDLLGFHGMMIAGDAARFITKKSDLVGDMRGVKRATGNEKPPGEWNQVRIRLQGGAMTVWFNGEKVNEATDVEPIAGFVGLQSEGGEVHFRNVRLTELE